MDVRQWNRKAWDGKVKSRVPWAIPVEPDTIARARQGNWTIVLTAQKPVPADWLGKVEGKQVLCLAGSGGQQAPVLAAAGAQVTVLDNSPAMLDLDRQVAARESLHLDTHLGDMADLSAFSDGTFDLVFHPVSNCFVPEVRPVWREAHRVLKPGGRLLAGFMNPASYIFDPFLSEDEGELKVSYPLPYADATDLSPEQRQRYLDRGEALEFSHTLSDQLAGQLEVGFILTGFYEDSYAAEAGDALTRYMPTMLATSAVKP